MTPSMGMAAPKGMAPAAPQAGLAAIAQPATAPKGMSSGNMAQVMAMARKMSDAQLAEVLQGKSLDVPQYVAMTEAMGRKSLRTAMDGQQAMAQAQQPSVKQKLLMGDQLRMPQGMPQQPVMAADGGLMYDGGGIAELPAPNMDSMGMAGGGIVAFSGKDNDQQVEDEQARKDREDLKYGWENTKAAARDILTLPGRGLAGAFETAVTRPVRAMGVDMPYLPASFYGGDASSLTPHMDTLTRQRQSKSSLPASPTAVNTDADTQPGYTPNKELNPAAPIGGPTIDQINALNARPRASSAPNEKAGLGATDEFGSYMDMVKKNNADYLSKLEGMGAKQREGLAKLKSQGAGEALMNLSGALFANPTMAMAMGQGAPAVAKTAAASRKEQQAIEQSANDYDLNLAKAQEAAAKGDMEAALKYKQLAQEAKYQQGMLAYHNASLNKPGESMQLLNAIRKPGESLSDTYARMQNIKKPTDVISKTDALKEYNDRIDKDLNKKFEKKFPTFDSYYNTLSTKAGGGGAIFLGFE
jgi:hypothetical protein